MRLLIQRTSGAELRIAEEIFSAIGKGLLIP